MNFPSERRYGIDGVSAGREATEGTPEGVSAGQPVATTAFPQVAAPGTVKSPAKGRGRPKRFDGALRVPLTAEQRAVIDGHAERWGVSAAEAVRRVLDGAPVPAPVERIAVEPEQYEAIIEGMNAVRGDLNRTAANAYRLARDAYGGPVPTPPELDELRAEVAAARDALSVLAVAVSGVSPW